MTKMTFKSIFAYLIKILFAGVLIYYMVHKGQLDFSKLFKDIPFYVFLLGSSFVLLTLFLNNLRWTWLLKSQELSCTLIDNLKICFIGLFFNFMIPSAVGGDVMRSYYVARNNQENKLKAAFSVVVDRIFGLFNFLVFALVAMVVNLKFVFSESTLTQIFFSVLFITFGMVIFSALSLSKRFRNFFSTYSFYKKIPFYKKFVHIYNAIHSYGDRKSVLLISLVISFISQTFIVAFMYLVAQFMGGDHLTVGTFFFAVPIGLIVISLPIAPAGIGVGQIAFAYLFQIFSGSNTDVGQLVITAYQMTLILWGLLGALFYIQRGSGKSVPSKDELNYSHSGVN